MMKNTKRTLLVCFIQVRGNIVVSISACHAEDPGSIPGRGVFVILEQDWQALLCEYV